MKTEFIITKEYKRFTEFCNACKTDQYIGLCYGPAGVGKSLSARYYAKWDKICKDINDAVPTLPHKIPSVNIDDLDTLIYTPEVHTTANAVRADILNIMFLFNKMKNKASNLEYNNNDAPLNNYIKLIIIDEVDRLKPNCLEQLRDIYDRYPIGMVLIGMPGIEKRLIRFAQLYSRVGFSHAFNPLSVEEVRFILTKHNKRLSIKLNPDDFSDYEAIASITRITQGNFRLINRLLKQCVRIMLVNELSSMTKEVVEAARECPVIGNP